MFMLFLEGMKANVINHVASYEVCQRNKSQPMSQVELPQLILIPSRVWKDISLDFVGVYVRLTISIQCHGG